MGIKSFYKSACWHRPGYAQPVGLGWLVSLALSLPVVGTALAHGPAGHGQGGSPGHAVPKSASKTQTDWGLAGDADKVTRTVRIVMSDDMRFTPDTIVVKLGETLRFEVVNRGKVMHEMVIGTQKELDAHAAMMLKHPNMEHDEPYMAHVSPGGSESLIWQFNRPGDFHFACLIPGHYQAGMTGRIAVSRAAAGADGAGLLLASAAAATSDKAGSGDDWTEAEIRRVDVPNKRMTLKHGEIKGLDMPPMTMVFYVEDAALLQGLKEGDKVRVRVRLDGKRYMVTAVSPP